MKATVLHKTDWNICVKSDGKFKIVHIDDFETRDEFKKIKVGDRLSLESTQVWWSIPMKTLKRLLKD